MFNTSHQVLKLLAAFIWLSGVVVLYIKGVSIFFEAESIKTESILSRLFFILAIIFGFIKAKFLFKPVCIKNLKRIKSLKQPKLWEFYRFRFFIFLFSMVLLGSFLSHQAHDNYPLLITVLIIDISVGTALLTSSMCFWQKNN
jgi:hypothetical protein